MKLLVRIYGALLVLYPRSFRKEYCRELTLAFSDLINEAAAKKGAIGILLACLWSLGDLATSSIREHVSALRAGRIMALSFAAVSIILLAYVDLNASEVQAPLLIILGASFLLGAFDSKKALLWGCIIGCVLPMLDLFRMAIALDRFDRAVFSEFLIVIPSVIGAGAGVVARSLSMLPSAAGSGRKACQFTLCAITLAVGFFIGLADFTLITPVNAIVGVTLCGIVLGYHNEKPIVPAALLGFGVPLAVTCMMAMRLHPMRHHFVFIDARAIVISVAAAAIASMIKKSIQLKRVVGIA